MVEEGERYCHQQQEAAPGGPLRLQLLRLQQGGHGGSQPLAEGHGHCDEGLGS